MLLRRTLWTVAVGAVVRAHGTCLIGRACVKLGKAG